MTTNAAASGFKVALVGEATWGTNPGTGGAYIRLAGGAGKTGTETTMSREITTYEATDVVRTRVTGGGSYNFELSYETADKGLELVLGSVFGQAFSTNILKVGTLAKSMSIEETLGGITTPIYRLYTGAICESFRIDVRPGDMITGSFSFVSKKEAVGTSQGVTAPSAANTNPVMNPLDSIQTLKWGGSSVTGCTAFSMEFRRPVIQFPQLSSVDPAELVSGTFEATGSISIYVTGTTQLADYLAFTERALEITLGGVTNKKYLFNFAKCNFTDGGIESVSKDAPLIQTFNWSAKYDATDTTCKVTRTA